MNAFVTVKKFGSRIEADLAKAHLESEGIQSFVSADDVGGLMPPTMVSSIELKVNSQDLKKAEKVLEQTTQK